MVEIKVKKRVGSHQTRTIYIYGPARIIANNLFLFILYMAVLKANFYFILYDN